MVAAKTLNTLLGFSAVIGLLSGLIFPSGRAWFPISKQTGISIAFVSSWAPWRTLDYNDVGCTIVSRRIIECCVSGDGDDGPCDSALVAFEVDMIEKANFTTSVVGLGAPYSGPVSLTQAEAIYNETANLIDVPGLTCSAPLNSNWDRVWKWQNVGNLTGCDRIPVLGEVVYTDSAKAEEFQETFLGIWIAFLVVMVVCIILLVIAALLSNKNQPDAA